MFKFVLISFFISFYLSGAELDDWYSSCFKKLSLQNKNEVIKAIKSRIDFYKKDKNLTISRDDFDTEKMNSDARNTFTTLALKIQLHQKDKSKILDDYLRSLELCNEILNEESAKKTRDDDAKINSMYDEDEEEVMV